MMGKLDNLARGVAAVTPGASALPGGPCLGLMVTVSGNLSFTAKDGSNSGTIPVTAGDQIPVVITHVLAATTATVLALY